MSEESTELQIGKFYYIDPNNINSEGEKASDTEILHDYEDYNILVDLYVVEQDRYSCGNTSKKDLENSKIHFIGGTNGYLTSNYTNLTLKDIENGGNVECIGIESININYQSFFMPTIDITFTDVRGASLMVPSEISYTENQKFNTNTNSDSVNNIDLAGLPEGSFYKALFSFPPPVFYLKIKGLYGDAVTYKLALTRINMSLDASTGNFNIHGSFVGYMYGILADLPAVYCAIAPYTESGSKKWEDSGTTLYSINSGMSALKFPVLNRKINEVLTNGAEKLVDGSVESDTYIASRRKMDSIKDVIDNFPFNEWCYEKNDNGNGKYTKCITTESGNATFKKELEANILNEKKKIMSIESSEDIYKNASRLLSEYIIVNSGSTSSSATFNNITIIECKKDENGIITYSISGQSGTFSEVNQVLEKTTRNNPQLKNALNSGSCNRIYLYTSAPCGDIIGDLNKKYKDSKVACEKNFEILRERASDEAANLLGFDPTIKTTFQEMFCHMDNFMRLFYDYLDQIRADIDNNKRLISKSKAVNTDIPSGLFTNSDKAPIAPFTKFLIKDEENNSMKEAFPTDFDESFSSLPEVKFVDELIKAAKAESEEYEELLEIQSDNSDPYNPAANASSYGSPTYEYIPTNCVELAQKCVGEAIENPYSFINAAGENSVYLSNGKVGDYVLSVLLFRMIYNAYLTGGVGINNERFKNVGSFEALNVISAFGKYSDNKEFYDLLDEKLKNVTDLYTSANNFDGSQKNRLLSDCYGNKEYGTFLKKAGDDKSKYIYLKDNSSNNFKLPIHSFYEYQVRHLKSEDSNCMVISSDGSMLDKSSYEMIEGKGFYNWYELAKQEISGYGDEYDYDKIFTLSERGITNYSYGAVEENKYGIGINISTMKKYDSESEGDNSGYKIGNITPDLTRVSVDGDYVTDLFSSKIYYDQETIVSGSNLSGYTPEEFILLRRLYLFLTSLNRKFTCDYSYHNIYSQFGSLNQRGFNGYRDYTDILLEGAFYWRYKYMTDYDNVDPIICTFTHVKPDKTHFYIKENTNGLCVSTKNNDYYGFDSNSRPFISGGTYYEEKLNKCLNEFINYALSEDFSKILDTMTPRATISGSDNYKVDIWIFTDLYDTYKPTPGLPHYGYKLTNSIDANGIGGHLNYDVSKAKPCKGKIWNYYYIDGLQPAFKDGYPGNDILKELRVLLIDGLLNRSRYCYSNSLADGIYSDDKNVVYECRFNGNLTKDYINNIYKSFKERIEAYINASSQEDGAEEVNSPVANSSSQITSDDSSEDIRLSVYKTLKTIYEKWICSNYREYWFLNSNNKDNIYSNFIFIDNFYKDIGSELVVNIEKWMDVNNTFIHNSDVGISNRSVYSALYDYASQNGCLMLSIPFMFGLKSIGNGGKDSFKNLFTVKNYNSVSNIKDENTFAIIYTYDTSHCLDVKNSQYSNDGFDICNTNGDAKNLLNSDFNNIDEEDIFSYSPCFGVTYARQGQSYFTNITLTTDNPNVTEYSISSLMNIASSEGQQPRLSSILGQGIYNNFSNYSYQCKVTMLGDVMISPLMYFQLNNVPMWHGVYIIMSVKHSVSQGKMTTEFTGVRICKNRQNLVNKIALSFDNVKLEEIKDEHRITSIYSGSLYTTDSIISKEDMDKVSDAVYSSLRHVDFNGSEASGSGEITGYCSAYGYYLGRMSSIYTEYQGNEKYKERMIREMNPAWSSSRPTADGEVIIKKGLKSKNAPINYANTLAKRLGSKHIPVCDNVSGSYVANLLSDNSNYNEGDIVIYWCDNIIKDYNSSHTPGHVQVFHDHDGLHWLTSVKDNYGTSFVYNKYVNEGGNGWHLHIVRPVKNSDDKSLYNA